MPSVNSIIKTMFDLYYRNSSLDEFLSAISILKDYDPVDVAKELAIVLEHFDG